MDTTKEDVLRLIGAALSSIGRGLQRNLIVRRYINAIDPERMCEATRLGLMALEASDAHYRAAAETVKRIRALQN